MPNIDLTLSLTPLEARALRSYLADRLDEMETDKESIDEEDPGLMPAMQSVHAVLDMKLNQG